ncbi:MAG: FxsA family protein, partial [Halodesulfovibrio sp.]
NSQEYQSFLLGLHKVDQMITPSTIVGYALFAFMMGLLPVLGNQIQRAAFPLWFNFMLWIGGIIVSAWLLQRGSGACVGQLLRDIRMQQKPAFETLRGCVAALAACAIALPSPVLTIIGAAMLLPPVTRSFAIILSDRLREAGLID